MSAAAATGSLTAADSLVPLMTVGFESLDLVDHGHRAGDPRAVRRRAAVVSAGCCTPPGVVATPTSGFEAASRASARYDARALARACSTSTGGSATTWTARSRRYSKEKSRVDLAVSWPARPVGGTRRRDRRRVGRSHRGPSASPSYSSTDARARPNSEPRRLARAGLALRRPHNWIQLATALSGPPGRRQPRRLRAAPRRRRARLPHRCRTVPRRRDEQLHLNRVWTFRQRGHFAYQGMRFLVVSVAALVLNLAFLSILVERAQARSWRRPSRSCS